ncbi:tripartite tricarboxylate transporter substrate-binding protein [Ideonella sp. DXS22W]|uniref:Tripartite tricarboxylate transporter substrate-binding protein n=1 Tax=Pseudaquabacterium inlustre TaxID=2984192 RepID=A0ABU9CHP9_9BURK
MPTITRRLTLRASLALVALALPLAGFAPLATAQTGTSRIVVGFPPGGSADVIARLLADTLRETGLGTVMVDNKPGAAGRLAINAVRTAKPDGQTLLLVPSGPMVIFPHVFKKLDYDPVKDFAPVSLLARFNFGVVSGPATGAGTIAELMAKARAKPDTATYGTPGQGTAPHFLGVMLEQAMGVPFLHVPFQGGAPANTALVGGHVGYKIDVVSESAELHRQGKVKVIAVTGPERDPQVPEVPTLKEQGVPLEITAWFALYAPAGTPPEVLGRIEKATQAAVRSPALREKLQKLGYQPVGSTGTELAAAQKADLARWERPIKTTGVQLD